VPSPERSAIVYVSVVAEHLVRALVDNAHYLVAVLNRSNEMPVEGDWFEEEALQY